MFSAKPYWVKTQRALQCIGGYTMAEYPSNSSSGGTKKLEGEAQLRNMSIKNRESAFELEAWLELLLLPHNGSRSLQG